MLGPPGPAPARREFGDDPSEAQVRKPDTVEHYQQ